MTRHDESSWFVMMSQHESWWWIMTMNHHDDSSWCIMMSHQDASWWMKHSDTSWLIMMNHHVIVMNHDESSCHHDESSWRSVKSSWCIMIFGWTRTWQANLGVLSQMVGFEVGRDSVLVACSWRQQSYCGDLRVQASLPGTVPDPFW